MNDVGNRQGAAQQAAPSPDVLLGLDEEYADILALLDRAAAMGRIVSKVPQSAGVDVAWVGEPEGADRLVLHHTVNVVTSGVHGLVVPVGVGLGGQVATQRRPLWESDYCSAPYITGVFRAQAEAEGVKAMIAVPIVHDGELFGVLYGANRRLTEFGDRTVQALEQLAARTAAAQVVAERARHVAEVAVHEERRRVALELHDSVGAMLFTLRAGLQRLRDEPGLDEDIRTRLTTLNEHATEASAALRGSLRVLSAPPEEVALCVALRGHCRAFQDRTGIKARVITLTELPILERSRVGALADAAREALLNVEKHAQAQSVVVSVFAVREGVAVTVSDDGVGLDSDPAVADGLGLAAMTEQVARVGGSVTIGRNDDNGVTLQAWVPT